MGLLVGLPCLAGPTQVWPTCFYLWYQQEAWAVFTRGSAVSSIVQERFDGLVLSQVSLAWGFPSWSSDRAAMAVSRACWACPWGCSDLSLVVRAEGQGRWLSLLSLVMAPQSCQLGRWWSPAGPASGRGSSVSVGIWLPWA